MADKEIEINGKTIGENSKISLKVSTLLWIIAGLISLSGVGYFDMKSDIKSQQKVFEQEKAEYKEEIKKIIQDEQRYEREKREKITEDLGEMKGDIKVILEKTRNLEGSHSGNTGFSAPDTTAAPPH